jgi:Raf kinase inhibitor-like YbhB/YbcL family protein
MALVIGSHGPSHASSVIAEADCLAQEDGLAPRAYVPLALRDGQPSGEAPTAGPPTPSATTAITPTMTVTPTATDGVTATVTATPTEPAVTITVTPTGTRTGTATPTEPTGDTPTPTPTFSISRPAFKDGEEIPERYTCEGDDISPELEWVGSPAGTESFVIIVDDPDAPGGTFVHWVRFDIPGNRPGLAEGDFRTGIGGRNDFGSNDYRGPCPPPGRPHRYFFRLYALDVASLQLVQGATRQDVEQAMAGHALDRTEMAGRFGRREQP